QDQGSLDLVRLELARLELDRGGELKLGFSLRRALSHEPDCATSSVASLHHAVKELRKELLGWEFLLREDRDLFNQPLDSCTCGFDGLLLGHWRRMGRVN